MTGAELVAGLCLVVGVAVLGVGCYLGVTARTQPGGGEAQQKLEDARHKIDETQERIDNARESIDGSRDGGPEAMGRMNPVAASDAASAAASSVAEAKSALEQVGSIVGSLPEHLRFAGLLVLVGTVLISVATIQFGGTSLF